MKLFSRCKTCKLCCHNKHNGKLVIPLTDAEKKHFMMDKIVVEPGKDCEFLWDDGCAFGDDKPLVCSMFPLVITKDGLGVFEGCPLSKKFKEDMVLKSEQSNHYLGCLETVASLSKKDIRQLTKLYSKITWDKPTY